MTLYVLLPASKSLSIIYVFRLRAILGQSSRPFQHHFPSISTSSGLLQDRDQRRLPFVPLSINHKLLKTHQQNHRHYSSLLNRRIKPYTPPFGTRGIGWIPTILRSVLKIRYLLLGGALGGGASLAKQYEEWKKNLPDTDWIKDLVPEIDINKLSSSLLKASEQIKGKANEIDLDPAVKKIVDFRTWFEKRLDNAIQAADKENGVKSVTYEEEEESEKQAEQQVSKEEKVEAKPQHSEKPNTGASMFFYS